MTGKEVFDRLVRDDRPILLGFVSTFVHHEPDVDDVCQTTLSAAWAQFEQYDPDRSSFATWLRGIARHKIADFYRSNEAYRRHAKLVTPEKMQLIEEEFTDLIGERDDAVEWSSLASILRACIAALNKKQRDLVHQRYFEGKACGTIATSLKKKLNTVQVGLQRARAALRKCIVSKLSMEPRI